MIENPAHFWLWLIQFFGPIGSVLVVIVAAIVTLNSLITVLYMKQFRTHMDQLEHQLAEVIAAQKRQYQLDRLKRDLTHADTDPSS